MALQVDVHWSFRSPYSYLATPRLAALERRYELEIRVRPVLPLAVRTPEFFDRIHPLWPGYLLRDVARLAEYHGMAIAWPRPDPVVQTRDAEGRLRTAPEQPYIHRLTRLGTLAAERGLGLPFVDAVSQLVWSGAVQGWNEGAHLAEATSRAGLDLAELDAAAERERERLDAEIERSQRDLEAAGHWGVPTAVFRGESFFGQDRLDLLLWRLRQHGLAERRDA